jgi:hypothetical protein
MSLFSRRVPLYVSLPLVVGCGAAGYLASTWQPVPSLPTAQPTQGSVVANTELPSREPRRAPASSKSKSIVLPIEEIDLPTPAVHAAKAAERQGTDSDEVQPAPPSTPMMKAARRSPRADRPVRSTSKARPQRTAQQRPGPPAPPPTGLKSIPIIGPMFSLLQ